MKMIRISDDAYRALLEIYAREVTAPAARTKTEIASEAILDARYALDEDDAT